MPRSKPSTVALAVLLGLWAAQAATPASAAVDTETGTTGSDGANGLGGPGSPGAGGATGGIRAIPDWYAQGKPKPASPRVTFSTWKWYSKDDPLLESGLLGPVRLRTAVRRVVDV